MPPQADFYGYLRQVQNARSPVYRAYEAKPRVTLACERIAFYLPQFHRSEENDRFWGSGYTEWTRVVRAVPKFVGHYQPRLPGDLGFYDLRLEENLERQVALALNYGLTGFMFYYYWFGGKTALELPIRNFLRRRDFGLRYFLMWANENWTRRWDGGDDEVLLEQRYAEDEPERFIRAIADYLADERYLRVAGRPIIAVYCASKIPQIRAVAERWRNCCVKLGLQNPYLVSALTSAEGDPRAIGFDAGVEFPPHHMVRSPGLLVKKERIRPLAGPVSELVHSYPAVVRRQLATRPPAYRVFRTAFPSWDNSARRPDGQGSVFAGSTPERFAQWASGLLEREMAQPDAFRMVCFNAWNEWGEAAYLEPDAYLGHAYLDALHGVLARAADKFATQASPA